MKELLVQFIADYLDKATRPAAHSNLLLRMDTRTDIIMGDDIKQVVTRCMKFVEDYESTWWWNRSKIVSNTLRTFD